MKKELEFGQALCYVHGTINGVDIDEDDFGDKFDHDEENAEPYGCGDMKFDPKPSTPEVIDKYKITESEYQEICSELSDRLSFGCCGWCT